ncbi:MAG: hypothetical protein PVI51_01930 [candidate division WOR-3 bacterium]
MVQVQQARVQVQAGVKGAEEDSAAATVQGRGQAAIAFAVVVVRGFRTDRGFPVIPCNALSAARR